MEQTHTESEGGEAIPIPKAKKSKRPKKKIKPIETNLDPLEFLKKLIRTDVKK